MFIFPMSINCRMSLVNILKKSYRSLYINGVRSNERIKHIHNWVKERFEDKLGAAYKYYAYDPNDSNRKEFKVNGAFYPKCCDITICDSKDVPLAAISVKFITSNFKQNANNYFESMLGESYNIKRSGIIYAHILFCPNPLPYYLKGGGFKCKEWLKDKDFEKYIKLEQTKDSFSPDFTSINIIELKTDDYINPSLFKKMDPGQQIDYLNQLTSNIDISENNGLSQKTQDYINRSNVEQLINKISSKIKYK